MPDLGELVERFVSWAEPLYRTYGYLVVVLAALLEHTFFLAWALPGGILVAVGGFYAQAGDLYLPYVILFATIGFVVGDHLDYIVGRRGSSVLDRLTRGRTLPVSFVWNVRTLPALILAYTNTIPRAAMFMGGAASGLPYHRFLALSFSMALFWAVFNSMLGYWLGSNRENLISVLRAVGVGGQALLLLIAGSALLYYYQRRRRRA